MCTYREVRLKAAPFDLMNVTDISKTQRYTDKTNRHVDVNDPRYYIHGDLVADDPRFTKPRSEKKLIPDNHLLQTRDIPGAYPGWSSAAGKIERREFKNTNFVHDIEGAQADTIKHSITTRRVTHPLDKVYQSLDGDLLVAPVMSLLPPSLVTKPTLRSVGSENSAGAAGGHTQAVSSGDTLSHQMEKQTPKVRVTEPEDSGSIPGLSTYKPSSSAKASPRVPLSAIDSAAYSTAAPVIPPKTNYGSGATPRSARLSNTGATVLTAGDTSKAPASIAYADKFVASEYLLVPLKPQDITAPSAAPGQGKKPPLVKPTIDIPQLDLAQMNAIANKISSSRKSNPNSCRANKADAELKQEILSVRQLQ